MSTTKKPRLTDREKGKIEGLHEAGMSCRAVSRTVKRSVDTVCRVVALPTPRKNSKLNETPKRPGRQPSLTDRDTRRLVRVAACGEVSALQIKMELQVSVHVRTIQRTLARVDWLVYSKMVNTLPLKPEDKAARLTWAREKLLLKDAGPFWDSISSHQRRNGISTGLMAFNTTGGTCVGRLVGPNAGRPVAGP